MGEDDVRAAIGRIRSARDTGELAHIEQALFGRKQGLLTVLLRDIGTLPPMERKERACVLNLLKEEALHALQERAKDFQSAMGKMLGDDAFDVTLDLPKEESDSLHLIPEFISQAEAVFGRMGFDTEYGPEIETEEHQFDLLNFPRDHPARDAQDIFYLGLPPVGPGNHWLLRGHTSTVQIRYMRSHSPPFRMICPGKVYRKDADATHSPMFHQVEGLMIGTDINLAHMKFVMISAVRELVGSGIEFRFRSGYFPFVEPGLEMDMRWQESTEPSEVRRNTGRWMEVAGCGMVHPNVLRHCNIDPKKWQGFAFGFGVERLLMIKYGIPDLRLFYKADLRFLSQF